MQIFPNQIKGLNGSLQKYAFRSEKMSKIYIFPTLLPVCEYDQRSACFHERPLAFFLLLTADRATLSLSLRCSQLTLAAAAAAAAVDPLLLILFFF